MDALPLRRVQPLRLVGRSTQKADQISRLKAKDREWEVTRIKGKAAVFVGFVRAPDEKSAIEAAIREYKITNPNDQRRLAARPRRPRLCQ